MGRGEGVVRRRPAGQRRRRSEGGRCAPFTGGGGATWRIYPDGTAKEDKVPLAWNSFATPTALDAHTFGYRWNYQAVAKTDSKDGPLVTLPEYFRLEKDEPGRNRNGSRCGPKTCPTRPG